MFLVVILGGCSGCVGCLFLLEALITKWVVRPQGARSLFGNRVLPEHPPRVTTKNIHCSLVTLVIKSADMWLHGFSGIVLGISFPAGASLQFLYL